MAAEKKLVEFFFNLLYITHIQDMITAFKEAIKRTPEREKLIIHHAENMFHNKKQRKADPKNNIGLSDTISSATSKGMNATKSIHPGASSNQGKLKSIDDEIHKTITCVNLFMPKYVVYSLLPISDLNR